MRAEKIAEESSTPLEQLATLAEAEGPCVSIYLSGGSLADDSVPFRLRLKAALDAAARKLNPANPEIAGNEPALKRLYEFAKAQEWETKRGSLAIFYAANFMRIFRTPLPLHESVHIADEFYLTPLLPVLDDAKQFCILALSRNHVRVFWCTGATVQELKLPASVPTSVEQAGGFDVPDHDLENHSAAGSSVGAMRGIRFGTGSTDKKADRYLFNFFKILDREMNRLLKPLRVPLILAGVDDETALYRKAQRYPYLLDGGIHGSPEGSTGAHLHGLALGVLAARKAREEERILAEFSEKAPGGMACSDPVALLAAARNGQVQHLLLAEKQPAAIGMDALLNRIALETIRHRGRVTVLSHRRLPDRVPVGAVLRYPLAGVGGLSA